MDDKIFIQVILPLKLDWMPFYSASRELVEKEYLIHPELFCTSEPGATTGVFPHMNISLKRGTRVKVSFARHSYIGVVANGDTPRPEQIKRILDIEEIETDLMPITEEELKLWEFLSSYYLCSIGEVYKTAYPGIKIKQEQIAARMQEREQERMEKAVQLLGRKLARLEERILRRQEALAVAKKERRIALLEQEIKDLEEQAARLRAEKELGSGIAPAVARTSSPEEQLDLKLSPAQSQACTQIEEAFQQHRIVLLNGVTGSGKTEIYIRLAAECLRQGKNVLYLVPEILMGNQLAYRLREAFGDKLLSFNSSQTTAERYRIAERLQTGEGYIVMGTRSAIFLPHRQLGLIIVDEEHDSSYKQQDSNPRYNGRDVAVVMAGIFHSHIILGSATPSLESLYNCEKGRYTEVYLAEKYYEADSAEVTIIDTLAERKKRGMKGLFSFKLIEQIRQTLTAGEQVVILRSRRAYSPIVQCEQCGNIPHCPHCNVTLSYHKATGRLLCHHCGYSQAYNGRCTLCNGRLTPMGSGTQKVEEEVRTLFPEASVARLDSDTVSSKAYLSRTIQSFYEGRTDILIGTQIVAKGLDFPNLSLVVMLQADAMLGIEDFRADERALQLLEQFRGRCARRNRKGRFIIQTSQPGHPVYQQIMGKNDGEHNIIGTFLEERKLFNYPPYTRTIHLILKDQNEERLQKLADALYINLCKTFGLAPEVGIAGAQNDFIQIIPPFSPVVDKVSDKFIRHIRLSFRRDSSLSERKSMLKACLTHFEEDRRYSAHITTDVDPI